jgi:lipid II:glycine glycyltransferase (peptidoglycan interpeptide bridge formation enzyme)
MNEMTLVPTELEDLTGGDNLLQTAFWGGLKSGFGWSAFAFKYTAGHPLLVLVRELGAGNSLAYVPHGLKELGGSSISGQWTEAADLAQQLKPHLPGSCVFIRIDPLWNISNSPHESASAALQYGFKKAPMDIQPPSTVILDLTPGEEELLKGMKSKTRYNIRLSAKKGVKVETDGVELLKPWYELYRITAERDKIALHSYEYYERLFQLAAEKAGSGTAESWPELRLLQAVIDGKAEAGIIISLQGGRATYLYGASSNNKRSLMPAYALQWEAIKQAAAAGCTSYDFFGIPPADNPDHPMHGLYRFKTGFGGSIVHRPGSWDYPYKNLKYSAFTAAEKLRNYYYKKLRKRL